MFIPLSESYQDILLRSEQTFCKNCDRYVDVKLVERVRTVTAMWFLKSAERTHFLVCGVCDAQFLVKPHHPRDIQQAAIHELFGMTRGRHVPFFARAILSLAVLGLPIPLVNLVLAFVASRNRAFHTPFMNQVLKIVWWTAAAVNAVFLATALFETLSEGRLT